MSKEKKIDETKTKFERREEVIRIQEFRNKNTHTPLVGEKRTRTLH